MSINRKHLCLYWLRHTLNPQKKPCNYGNSCHHKHINNLDKSTLNKIPFPSYLRYPLKAALDEIDEDWVIEEVDDKKSWIYFIATEESKRLAIRNLVEDVKKKKVADLEESFKKYFEKHPQYGSVVLPHQNLKTTSVAVKRDEKSLRFWSVHKGSAEITPMTDLHVSHNSHFLFS